MKKEYYNEGQVERWFQDEHFQNFLRQVHTDIYVGLKHGAPTSDIKKTMKAFCQRFLDSVDFHVKVATISGK